MPAKSRLGININQHRSKEDRLAYQREWRKLNKDKVKRYEAKKNASKPWLKRRYGMTKEDYEYRLEQQNYRCAICQTREPGGNHKVFHVDHSHKWGHVRGLLCDKCNRGLGYFNDDVSTLVAAAYYLQENDVASNTH